MNQGKTKIRSISAANANGLGAVLDWLLPHICPGCRKPMDAGKNLCSTCWAQLQFITTPQCACCGLPFGFDLGEGTLCAGCIEYPPLFSQARAALRYDDYSKPLILAFKHGDKTHLRLLLSRLALPAASALLQGVDWVAPVPLHWTRTMKRKYNQAALISSEIAAHFSIPHDANLLLRHKRTLPHQNMDRKERQKNVRNAFRVKEDFIDKIQAKTILLVDDVYTTGVTLNECSRVLLEAGAGSVRVLTLARVCLD